MPDTSNLVPRLLQGVTIRGISRYDPIEPLSVCSKSFMTITAT